MDFLHRHIEALIFCAPEPLGVNEMVSCLTEMFGAVVPAKDVELALVDLCAKYGEPEFSFALEKLGGGYQFLTKPAYQPSISILLRQNSHKRLPLLNWRLYPSLPTSSRLLRGMWSRFEVSPAIIRSKNYWKRS